MKYRIIEEIDGLGESEFFAEFQIEPDINKFFGKFKKSKWHPITRYEDIFSPPRRKMKFKSSEDALRHLKRYYFPKTYKLVIEGEI